MEVFHYPRVREVDALMTAPTFNDDGEGQIKTTERSNAECTQSQRFILPRERSYTTQYSHLYYQRLLSMRGAATEAVKRKHPKAKFVERILEVEAQNGSRCAMVGTMYKTMPLKPEILKEYEDEMWVPAPPVKDSYVSEEDSLVLEDESGRIALAGCIDVKTLVTGLVVALVGHELESGIFKVEDVCFPGLAPQPSLPDPSPSGLVVLASGLRFGHADAAQWLLPLQLFVDYVSGHSGSNADHEVQSTMTRVVLAGNTMYAPKSLSAASFKQKGRDKEAMRERTAPLRQADMYISQLASGVSVDLMSGADDPANYTLPQQPMHRGLFSQAARYSTFSTVPNPYEATIAGVRFLGTSGQNVDDVSKYTAFDSKFDILEGMLQWRHVAPTCPDTLAVYPFSSEDPFILSESPHVFFAGNQAEFDTRVVKGPEGQSVRCILVPDFSKTGSVVVLDLATLECSTMSFEVDF